MSAPQTIVYDFGGVLSAPLIAGMLKLAQRVRRDITQIIAAMSMPIDESGLGPLAALEVARITEPQAVDIFCQRLQLTPEELHGGQQFGRMWLEMLGIDTQTLQQARALKQAGFRLGLATNNVAEWRPIWQAMVDPGLFEFVVDSSALQHRKPSPEFYLEVIRACGQTRDVLLIDDEPDNIRSAHRLGFRTLLWGPDGSRSRRELERMLQ